MKVAIIPARGGSKRIPRKNIKFFGGKPMIAWAIEAAIESKVFDRILVSTDDDEIADVALAFGAEVPFIRPATLSGDFVGTTDVIAHAVSSINSSEFEVDAACCIYATSPLLESEDLIKGLQVLESCDWHYAFSVTDFAAPVYRAFNQTVQGGVKMLFPQYFDTRSQDLPIVLHDAGQFYWGRAQAWLTQEKIFGDKSAPVMIPRSRVQDIDTPEDWIIAERLFNLKLKGSNV
jgi:N-acylneuraminate cytidylyltransferase